MSALLMSTALIQVMLFVTLLSEDAFNFMLNMTSALTLIPFLLAAGYALKLASATGGRANRPACTPASCVGGAGHALHRLPALRRGPQVHARLVHHLRPRQHPVRDGPPRAGPPRSRRVELVILAVSVIGAVIGVIALAAGWITV